MTSASLPSKKRILTVCVRLFLEQGYKKTTVSEIVHKAEVSNSSFQNIFRAKDGVRTELVAFMFENQFAMARSTAGRQLPPVCVYAVETAKELFGIFGPYQPELTLEKKLRLFLMMNLRADHVPEAEIAQAVAFIEGLNIRAISGRVMQELFRALAMHFEFSLDGIATPQTTEKCV